MDIESISSDELMDYIMCLSDFDDIHPTGSRYICDPPVMDTDEDYIVLSSIPIKEVAEEIRSDGWLSVKYEELRAKDLEFEEAKKSYAGRRFYTDKRSGMFSKYTIDLALKYGYRSVVPDGKNERGYLILTFDNKPRSEPWPEKFLSFRKGRFNLVVSDDPDYYHKFVTSTELAKRFNLTKKQDRVDLFAAITGVRTVGSSDNMTIVAPEPEWIEDPEEEWDELEEIVAEHRHIID